MFGRHRPRREATEPQLPRGPLRVDVPVYLDAGIALSLSASLSRGVALERSVQTAIKKEARGAVKSRVGVGPVASVEATADAARSSAVTENEVRMQTEESIFNAVRSALDETGLLKSPSTSWAEANWLVGDFVEFTPGRVVVPLVSAFARLRVIVESLVSATGELSPDALANRVPQLLQFVRSESDGSADLDDALALFTELGEIARALADILVRLEEEAESSGLIDIVMFEHHLSTPRVMAVASLDRRYVDTKLLRRLGQGKFGVLGKVLRTPEDGTAFNAYRNSMLGATNQLSVWLHRFTELLYRFPLIFGDSLTLTGEEGDTLMHFVGSASAISELRPLWMLPSLEVLPVAIYA